MKSNVVVVVMLCVLLASTLTEGAPSYSRKRELTKMTGFKCRLAPYLCGRKRFQNDRFDDNEVEVRKSKYESEAVYSA